MHENRVDLGTIFLVLISDVRIMTDSIHLNCGASVFHAHMMLLSVLLAKIPYPKPWIIKVDFKATKKSRKDRSSGERFAHSMVFSPAVPSEHCVKSPAVL